MTVKWSDKGFQKNVVLVCFSVVWSCNVVVLPQVLCVTSHYNTHIKESVLMVKSLKTTLPILPMPKSFQ